MANYYSDHPEIGFYLNHPLMARIVELKEKGFADAKSRFSTSPATWQPTSLSQTLRALTWKVHTLRTVV